MNLANKTFRNNRTGEVVKVIDSFENIAILENKQKVDVRTLTDSNHYTEQIDPTIFFNNQGSYNILAEKIKNIPTNMIQDDAEEISTKFGGEVTPAINESAVVMMSEEDEKAELARKYGASLDNTRQIESQQQAFARILGEDSLDELPSIPQVNRQPEEPVMRVEVNREETNQEQINQPSDPIRTQVSEPIQVEDPIITMFRKTKRNVNFNFNIKISEKIPRLDFIEMMEDSYEISMIDFLADEFTNKILQDPSVIRDSIKDKIKQIVYGGESETNTVNNQITDSVTQVDHSKVIETEPRMVNESGKKTTTRKPRAKKESTEK